jgi:hypothetical protein
LSNWAVVKVEHRSSGHVEKQKVFEFRANPPPQVIGGSLTQVWIGAGEKKSLPTYS